MPRSMQPRIRQKNAREERWSSVKEIADTRRNNTVLETFGEGAANVLVLSSRLNNLRLFNTLPSHPPSNHKTSHPTPNRKIKRMVNSQTIRLNNSRN